MTLLPRDPFPRRIEDELFEALMFGRAGRPEEGRSYMVRERKPDKAFDWFLKLIDDGYHGVCITRQHPNHVAKREGAHKARVVWLSTTLGRNYVDPHNLGSLTNLINTFITENDRTVILLDGLEYLMINNDFPRILKFLEYINEIVMPRKAVLILSVDPRAFEEKELALLERNLQVVDL